MSEQRGGVHGAWAWRVPVTPLVAGFTVISAATALAGVVNGWAWLLYVAATVAVVVAVGMSLRPLRVAVPIVALAQLGALCCLVVALFTEDGLLRIFPGPAALHDVSALLSESVKEVQTGIPPVPATPALLCLIVIALGLVAVLVDLLAVGVGAPAASGLLLLCAFAVPASLSDALLPWWTFALGTGSFTLLLAVDGAHRQRAWRGQLELPARIRLGQFAPTATAIACLAVVVALVVGSNVTLIGTAGRLPGTGSGLGNGEGGVGIKPFTTLRGMLDRSKSTQLFQVRGLDAPLYLRTLTLRDYVPNQGWDLGGAIPEGVPIAGQLPPAPGTAGFGTTTTINVTPINWNDVWLPIYGTPRRLDNVPGNWRYDRITGTVYSERPRHATPYAEQAVLTQPTADQLRSVDGFPYDIDPVYRQVSGVSPRVVALTRQITANARTEFDKAAAVYRYFTEPGNGFTYSLRTAKPMTSDALDDFLFNGKTGYCEQYASAMAVMLRTIGVPARVAIGFTAGTVTGDTRTITSEDAHAWVEVFFPGYGWTTFDPTPLADGRAVVPPYLVTTPAAGSGTSGDTAAATTTTAGPTTSTSRAPDTAAAQNTAPALAGAQRSRDWLGWVLGGVVLLALAATLISLRGRRPAVLARLWGHDRPAVGSALLRRVATVAPQAAVAGLVLSVILAAALVSWWLAVVVIALGLGAAPAVVREFVRRRRLRAVAALGTDAASAAWQELVAESRDRGTDVARGDTLRVTAQRLVREHGLDEAGAEGLRSVVGAVERDWYGGHHDPDPDLPEAVERVRRSMAHSAPLPLRARVLPRSILRHAGHRAGDRAVRRLSR